MSESGLKYFSSTAPASNAETLPTGSGQLEHTGRITRYRIDGSWQAGSVDSPSNNSGPSIDTIPFEGSYRFTLQNVGLLSRCEKVPCFGVV